LGKLEMRMLSLPSCSDMNFLYEFLPPKSSSPAVIHAHTREIIHIISGGGGGCVSGKRFKLVKGDCLTVPPGAEHVFFTRKKSLEAISIFSPPMDRRNPDARIMPCKKRTGR